MDLETQLQYGVIVIELKDVVPRRDPSLPNIYVSVTTMDLEQRTELLNKGKSSAWLKNNVTSLRHDLSIAPSLTAYDEAKDLERSIINTLRSQGYTVNRNTDIWTVYVIELDSKATTNPGKGYVYVGETMKSPEARFAEHIGRASNSKTKLFASVVANHGKRLRMDLAPKRRYFDVQASKKAESEWAEHLRNLGYYVKGGH
jgi:hypothetical protein